MTKVIFFGERTGEIVKIRSSIEFAFDVYRKKLCSFMEEIESVVERTIEIDKVYSKFTILHNNYRKQLANIPYLYEINEFLLRELCNGAVHTMCRMNGYPVMDQGLLHQSLCLVVTFIQLLACNNLALPIVL